MNISLANVVQFAVVHGVVLGSVAVSLTSVIGICFKEMRRDRARSLRPDQENLAVKRNELFGPSPVTSQRSPSSLKCRWKIGDDGRPFCAWETVADSSRQVIGTAVSEIRPIPAAHVIVGATRA